MKQRAWKQVVLSVPEQYQDLLVGSLTAMGFEGFLQENGKLASYMEQRAWTKNVESSLQNLLSRFQKEFPQVEIRSTQRSVKQQNWNAAWERSIGIVEATNHIIVKPTWKKLRARDKGKIVLHIDPKMSFGTGHHETTRLCLTLLERYCTHGSKVLDFGTGTGVLAIAAVKLGAKNVLAIDNDEWSIENAKENIKKNGVTKKVFIKKGNAGSIPKKKFDLIVANIDYPTISTCLKKLLTPLRREGVLLLSGLLASDLNPFFDLLKHQSAIPLELADENEWIAVALVKANPQRIAS